jgi:hypothetical protein
MVYDANTGELRDDRKHLSMLEDFWLPRREGGKGTEITTLPAGQNLGQIEDVVYFQKKLLQSLNVPYSRLEPQGGGFASLGRSTEVTRDEMKFAKFVVRLRNKFSQLFDSALRTQLVLKGICTGEEWDQFKEKIYYSYCKDNNFTELRDAELWRERLSSLSMVDPYIGKYFSQTWAKKNILRMSDEEIKNMEKEMEKDGSTELFQQAMEAQTGQQPGQTQDAPPEDNTYDNTPTESATPQLDSQVEKYSMGINNK